MQGRRLKVSLVSGSQRWLPVREKGVVLYLIRFKFNVWYICIVKLSFGFGTFGFTCYLHILKLIKTRTWRTIFRNNNFIFSVEVDRVVCAYQFNLLSLRAWLIKTRIYNLKKMTNLCLFVISGRRVEKKAWCGKMNGQRPTEYNPLPLNPTGSNVSTEVKLTPRRRWLAQEVTLTLPRTMCLCLATTRSKNSGHLHDFWGRGNAPVFSWQP